MNNEKNGWILFLSISNHNAIDIWIGTFLKILDIVKHRLTFCLSLSLSAIFLPKIFYLNDVQPIVLMLKWISTLAHTNNTYDFSLMPINMDVSYK